MKVISNFTSTAVVVLCGAVAFSASTSRVEALATPTTDRRAAFGKLLSGGAITAAAVWTSSQGSPPASASQFPKTGQSNVFQGDYNDPNHPDCLRQVKVVGAPLQGSGKRSPYPVVEIVGYDGKSKSSKTCTDRPTRDDLWKVEGTVKSNDTAFIDFSSKGGPDKLLAKYEDGGIVFPDGNKWTKVVRGTPKRFPKDMSTLKSAE